MTIIINSIKNKRNYQEDNYISIKNSYCKLIGVFDGHGGDIVSKTLKNCMKIIINDLIKPTMEYKEIVILIIKYLDKLQKQILHQKIMDNQGSTLCIMIEYKDKLLFFNTGDSRAIGFKLGKLKFATRDHKPNYKSEKTLITSKGGNVTNFKNDVPRVNGVLAVSRTYGDKSEQKFITHRPDIYIKNKTDFDYILFATDGLWDVLTNIEIVSFITNNINEKTILKKLSALAVEKGSTDNITIILYKVD